MGAKTDRTIIFIASFALVSASLADTDAPAETDPRLVAQYLFDGDHMDATGNGHNGAELGTFFSTVADLPPLANLLATDAGRGGVYSYGNAEVIYDWKMGGNPNNNRLDIEGAHPLPVVPANAGITLMTWVKREAVNSMPNNGTITVSLAAGFVAAFFYWLIAGRNAGEWLSALDSEPAEHEVSKDA